MNKSESIKELASALVKFQGEVPAVKFDEKVKVSLKTGATYTFQYASMGAIKETCKPILSKHGLAVVQLIGENQLTTMILHESGEYISDTMQLRMRDSMTPQETGSLITYMKRYSYSAALGLVTDEDEDGNIASGNQAKKDEPKKLPELIEGTEDFMKAIEWLTNGGTIERLKKRRTITKEVETSLREAVKAQKA